MLKKLALLIMSISALPLFGAQAVPNGDFEVRTLSQLTASQNKKGDKFTVQVLSPESFKNALIEGEVSNSKASGKVKGNSELSFHFNKLVMPDGKTEIPIQADLKEIKNSKGVANIDEEGRAIGKSSKKKDLMVTGAMAGLGAAIGAAAGGKQGAAQGAAVGAAVGLTIAFTTKGEDIKLAQGSVFLLNVTKAKESRNNPQN